MFFEPTCKPEVRVDSPERRVLMLARKIIENPAHWCQNNYHKGERHCAAAAVFSAEKRIGEKTNAYHFLRQVMDPNGAVCGFNDTHTHAEVLAAFDRAIAAK